MTQQNSDLAGIVILVFGLSIIFGLLVSWWIGLAILCGVGAVAACIEFAYPGER